MSKLLDWAIGGLAGVWGYIATALAALAGILVVLFSAKKAGKDEVRAETAQKEVENAKKGNEVEREVATTKPDAVRERLRKYQRD